MKNISQSPNKNRANPKNIASKIVFVALMLALPIALLIALALHKPSGYCRPQPTELKEVHPYITHHILPTIYNGSQTGQPFTIQLTQTGLNQAISSATWPLNLNQLTIHRPQLALQKDSILIFSTITYKGIDFFASAVLDIKLIDGNLMIEPAKIKSGALTITPLALSAAKKFAGGHIPNSAQPLNRVVNAVIQQQAIDPVFEIDKNKLRITDLTLKPGQIDAILAPVP